MRAFAHPCARLLAVTAVTLLVAGTGCAPADDLELTERNFARSVSHAGLTLEVPDGWLLSTDDPTQLVLATNEPDLRAATPGGPRIVAHASTAVDFVGSQPDLERDVDANAVRGWQTRGVDTTVVGGLSAAVLEYDLIGEGGTLHHRTVLLTGDAGASAMLDLETPTVGQGTDELASVLDSVEIDSPTFPTADPPVKGTTPSTDPGDVDGGRAMAAKMVAAYGLTLEELPATEVACLASGFDSVSPTQRDELNAGLAISPSTATALERTIDGCLSPETQRRLLAAAFAESTDTPGQADCVAERMAPAWTFGRALAVAMTDADTSALVADLIAALEACEG